MVVSLALWFVSHLRTDHEVTPHTCECMYIAQVDSKLTSFVTAMSEISSVTDPTYGPDSGGGTEAEVSSLRDPQGNSGGTEKSEVSSLTDIRGGGSGSRVEADAGVGGGVFTAGDTVVVGVNSVASESGENVFPSVSSVTFEDDINLCECPECRSG